ncbi:MAG TPA: hypothetical protein VGL59_18895 [Polyangia bacterium]
MTFGTVQVVPPANQPGPALAAGGDSAAPAAADQAAPPAPRPRELAPVLHQLHDRAVRVHAH